MSAKWIVLEGNKELLVHLYICMSVYVYMFVYVFVGIYTYVCVCVFIYICIIKHDIRSRIRLQLLYVYAKKS